MKRFEREENSMKKVLKWWMAACLLFAVLAGPSVAKADNTTLETASPIQINQWVAGKMGDAGSRYYRFQMPAAGTAQVEFRRKTEGITENYWGVDFWGYNAQDERYDTMTFSEFHCVKTNSHFLPEVGVPAGTFFVEVVAGNYSDGNVEYEFRVNVKAAADWEKEYNDSIAFANPIVLQSGKTSSINAVSMTAYDRTTDQDYFYLDVPKKGYIQYSLSVSRNLSDSGTWTADFHSKEDEIFCSIHCDNQEELEAKSACIGVPAGRYYISAGTLWSNASFEKYKLEVYYQEASGWESEPNANYKKADAAETDQVLHGSIHYYDDLDYYRLDVLQDGNYRLDFRYTRDKESGCFWAVCLENDSGESLESWTCYENKDPETYVPVSLKKGVYYIIVQGNSSGPSTGDYSWSMKQNITPGTVKKVANQSKGLKVTWSASAGANEYILQKKAGSGDWTDVTRTAKTSYLDKAVSNGTKYQYRVIAAAGAARSAASSEKTAWRLTAPSIQTKKAAPKQITITWKKNAKASGYQIQLATNSKFTAGKKTYTVKKAGTTKYVIKKLKWNTSYYIRIRTYKSSTSYVSAWSKAVKVKTK